MAEEVVAAVVGRYESEALVVVPSLDGAAELAVGQMLGHRRGAVRRTCRRHRRPRPTTARHRPVGLRRRDHAGHAAGPRRSALEARAARREDFRGAARADPVARPRPLAAAGGLLGVDATSPQLHAQLVGQGKVFRALGDDPARDLRVHRLAGGNPWVVDAASAASGVAGQSLLLAAVLPSGDVGRSEAESLLRPRVLRNVLLRAGALGLDELIEPLVESRAGRPLPRGLARRRVEPVRMVAEARVLCLDPSRRKRRLVFSLALSAAGRRRSS